MSFLLTIKCFLDLQAGGAPLVETAYTWATIGGRAFDIAFYFDRLSAVMALIVTGVGSVIHIYSTGYMHEDKSYARFFAYLNLFLFFMLLLVLGRSLLVLFVGWEGVGLASYLLIGFWFEDPVNARAGKKAFVTNRIGDAGFLLGMFLLYFAFGTLDMDRINAAYAAGTVTAISASLAGILLFIGASGKSAQIPLHVWLPDAMAGPTPVSALIHAATMVTAGVYLVARMSAIYMQAPTASAVVAVVGAATAFFAATIAVAQTDIKKVLAYSTVSQLGFMFVALGVGAYGVAIFHVVHARVLQGLPVPRRRQRDPRALRRAGHPQDGRAREEDPDHVLDVRDRHRRDRRHPAARRVLVEGRDPVVRVRELGRRRLRCCGRCMAATALMTAFYMFRLLWLVFLTPSRMEPEVEHHVHESPLSMTGVLMVLAVLSAVGGFVVDPALPRAAAAAAEDAGGAAPLRDAAADPVGRDRHRGPRRPRRSSTAAGSASARGDRHALRGAAPAARQQVLRRRDLRAAAGQAAEVDLRHVFLRFGDRFLLDGTLNGLARPRAAHRGRARPRADRQPAPVRVLRAGRRHRLRGVELPPWLTRSSSTSSCTSRSPGSLLLLSRFPRARPTPIRWVTFWVMVVQFALTAVLYVALRPGRAAACSSRRALPWIPDWGVYYQIGLDGYNVLLVLLTAFLGPLVVAGAFTAITKDVKLFYSMVFLIQFAMLGTFVAQDLFVFYLFWETMLIPMFLHDRHLGRRAANLRDAQVLPVHGVRQHPDAGRGDLPRLLAAGRRPGVTSFAFADLYQARLPLPAQILLLSAFGLSFAIKVPMVPLHTWLPDAHVEAPTTGSVILAGVLLKMGTYGFMKLGFPLFPDATRYFTPLIMTLAVVSIVYGACLALVQNDIKKIIAYSSISHLGYVMLGLISLDLIGIQGAIIQMVSHGLTAAGLFLMVGMIYERCHTRELAAYGGLAKLLPVYSVFFMILTLASIGLPTTSGFTGEFLVLLGAFTAVVAAARRRRLLPAAAGRASR